MSWKKSGTLCAAILPLVLIGCSPRIVPDYTKAHRIADGVSVSIWVADTDGKVVRQSVFLEPDQWTITHRSALKP
jgi:hypothetical protein